MTTKTPPALSSVISIRPRPLAQFVIGPADPTLEEHNIVLQEEYVAEKLEPLTKIGAEYNCPKY